MSRTALLIVALVFALGEAVLGQSILSGSNGLQVVVPPSNQIQTRPVLPRPVLPRPEAPRDDIRTTPTPLPYPNPRPNPQPPTCVYPLPRPVQPQPKPPVFIPPSEGQYPIYVSPNEVVGVNPQTGGLDTQNRQIDNTVLQHGRDESQNNGTKRWVRRPVHNAQGQVVGYQEGWVWNNSYTGQEHGELINYTPNGKGGTHQQYQSQQAGGVHKNQHSYFKAPTKGGVHKNVQSFSVRGN